MSSMEDVDELTKSYTPLLRDYLDLSIMKGVKSIKRIFSGIKFIKRCGGFDTLMLL